MLKPAPPPPPLNTDAVMNVLATGSLLIKLINVFAVGAVAVLRLTLIVWVARVTAIELAAAVRVKFIR